MSAAARASRETVERFIVLAEKLSEGRNATTAAQSPSAAETAPNAAPAATKPATDTNERQGGKLTDALRQLRETAENSHRKLPKL
jgi:hypothetical protein